MTTEQILNELRKKIKELGRIINSPIESEKSKDQAKRQLSILLGKLQELRNQVGEK